MVWTRALNDHPSAIKTFWLREEVQVRLEHIETVRLMVMGSSMKEWFPMSKLEATKTSSAQQPMRLKHRGQLSRFAVPASAVVPVASVPVPRSTLEPSAPSIDPAVVPVASVPVPRSTLVPSAAPIAPALQPSSSANVTALSDEAYDALVGLCEINSKKGRTDFASEREWEDFKVFRGQKTEERKMALLARYSA